MTRRDLSLWGLLAGVFLVAFLPTRLFDLHYYGLDLTRMAHAGLCALKRGFESGGLWVSDVIGHGKPFVGDPQSMVFYPPAWAVAWLAPQTVVDLMTALNVAVVTASAALLCRTFQVGLRDSLLVGLAYLGTGTVLDLVVHGVFLNGAWAMPAAWAGARLALRGRRWGAALVVLALTGGLTSGAVLATGSAAALVLVELASDGARRRRSRREYPLLLLAIGLTVVALVPVWWPVLVELGETARARGLSSQERFRWSFTPAHLVATWFPVDLVRPTRGGGNLLFALTGQRETWSATPHIGLPLLVASLLAARDPRARYALIVVAFGWLCALGDRTPFYPLLTRVVPLLDGFRYPLKHFAVVNVAVVALAAIGVSRRASKRWELGAFGFVALSGVAIFAWAWARLPAVGAGSQPSPAELLTRAGFDAAAGLIAFAAARATPSLRRFSAVVLVASVWLPGASSVRLGPRVDDVPWVAAGAVSDRDVVCLAEASFEGVYTLDEWSDWNLHLQHYAWGMPDLNACHDVRSAAPYGPLISAYGSQLAPAVVVGDARAARAAGCTHVLYASGASGQRPRPRVEEVERPVPEVFFVRAELPADATEAARLALTTDAVREAFSASDAERIDHAPHDVEVRVERPGALGVRVAFGRGWTVHGPAGETPPRRVLGRFLGFEATEPGVYRLRYRPPGWPWVWLGPTLAALAALARLFMWRSRRRAPRAGST